MLRSDRSALAGVDPLPAPTAWFAVMRCVVASVALLVRRMIHMPRTNVGRRIDFADGTSGRIYRETTVDRVPTDPCFLVVTFRLRWVVGRGHALFRWESLLNTPLFVGFPGFVSKLWLAHDSRGAYRGLYEWDGADRAARYARSLWHVLALVSEPGSIDYKVFPGRRRDAVLATPEILDRYAAAEKAPDGSTTNSTNSAWWRVVGSA